MHADAGADPHVRRGRRLVEMTAARRHEPHRELSRLARRDADARLRLGPRSAVDPQRSVGVHEHIGDGGVGDVGGERAEDGSVREGSAGEGSRVAFGLHGVSLAPPARARTPSPLIRGRLRDDRPVGERTARGAARENRGITPIKRRGGAQLGGIGRRHSSATNGGNRGTARSEWLRSVARVYCMRAAPQRAISPVRVPSVRSSARPPPLVDSRPARGRIAARRAARIGTFTGEFRATTRHSRESTQG